MSAAPSPGSPNSPTRILKPSVAAARSAEQLGIRWGLRGVPIIAGGAVVFIAGSVRWGYPLWIGLIPLIGLLALAVWDRNRDRSYVADTQLEVGDGMVRCMDGKRLTGQARLAEIQAVVGIAIAPPQGIEYRRWYVLGKDGRCLGWLTAEYWDDSAFRSFWLEAGVRCTAEWQDPSIAPTTAEGDLKCGQW